MIELTALTKRYGSFTAVDAIDLRVPKGELFGFLGPNGAGKTTTLRMIAGILRPTAGTVKIGGVDIAADPIAAKRILGFIPDRPFIYEKLTGIEFLRFVGGLYNQNGRTSSIAAGSCWRCSISRTGETSWWRATATACGRSSSSRARSFTSPT
jgi:ABC-type multidrug transport system ATPase subunit